MSINTLRAGANTAPSNSQKARNTGRPDRARLAPVIMAAQPKGGTRKSTTLAEIIFHLMEMGHMPWIIDQDKANPDNYKAHHTELKCECIAADREHGFTSIARRISDTTITGPILISCGAGLVDVFKENAGTLDLAASRVGRPFFVVVPIDLDVDSLNHIEAMREAMPSAQFFIIRPRHFGHPDEFEAFNESDLGHSFINQGRVIDLPAMPAALVRHFKSDRLSLAAIAERGDIAEVAALDTWRPRSRAALAPLLDW